MLESWIAIGNKLVAMAQDFPEDKYDFKVQKDQRTFAENLLHVAALDFVLIRRVSGSNFGPDFGEGDNPARDAFKTKADVVKFVQEAIADGAQVIQRQGDAGLDNTSKFFGNRLAHNSTICRAPERPPSSIGAMTTLPLLATPGSTATPAAKKWKVFFASMARHSRWALSRRAHSAFYDMAGSVWQWTEDCYDNSYAGIPADGRANDTPSSDPKANDGQGNCFRVDRGGSWMFPAWLLRPATRERNPADYRNDIMGFRVARTLP